MLETTFQSGAGPKETFDFIASCDAMELLQGHRLIPGIKQADLLQDNVITVKDSFGLKHREIISAQKFPKLLVFHIVPNRFLRIFVKSISEEWLIEANETGSKVTRSFSLIPRGMAGFFLPLFYSQLKKAIIKNNHTLSFHLLIQNKEINKPLFQSAKR
jgi:hypothetical protein